MSVIRVLIVEDHVYTRRGLEDALSEDPGIEIVGSAGTATQALSMASKLKPDIILLDLHLPEAPPASELLEAFCSGHEWKVIVLSSEERLAFIEAALSIGAVAFLSKAEPPERLRAVIRAVQQNQQTPIVSGNLANDVFFLSPALEEIVKLLARGMKYHEIAVRRGATAESTRKQCDRLQIKLGLSSREQLISWAVQHGYGDVD